jgi:hypothetical protein
MTEQQAIKIVQEHGRYHDRLGGFYSVRWPLTASRAITASDTRELVEKLMKQKEAKQP